MPPVIKMVLPDFYQLISDLTTADQIKELLRRFKRDFPKEVLVSGTKADVIEHLKSAVDAGRVPVETVRHLLRECEENGDQHIFYFRPNTQAVAKRCADGREVAKKLWGAKWEQTAGFPKYELVPSVAGSKTCTEFQLHALK